MRAEAGHLNEPNKRLPRPSQIPEWESGVIGQRFDDEPAGLKRSHSGSSLSSMARSAFVSNWEELSFNCLLIIASAIVMLFFYIFSSIMVPLIFAVFLTYVADPVMNLITRYPNEECCLRCCSKNTRKQTKMAGSVASLGGSSPLLNPGVPAAANHEAGYVQAAEEGTELVPPSRASFPIDKLRGPCRFCVRNFHMPRVLAVIVTISLGCFSLFLFGYIIYASVQTLESHYAEYEQGAKEFVNWANTVLSNFGLSVSGDLWPLIKSSLANIGEMVAGWAFGFMEQFVIMLIFLIYLLLSPVRPKAGVWAAADTQVRQYIRLKTLLSLTIGCTVGSILMALGVDLPWVFGLTTFICNFVPNVGSFIATILPLPLVILNPQLQTSSKILAFVLPFFAHQMVGNFIEPKIFGKSLDLHPIVVLVALGIFGTLWGVAGMILSVPIVAVLRIVMLQHLDVPFIVPFVRMLEGHLFEKYTERKKKKGHGRRKTVFVLPDSFKFPMDSLVEG